MESRKQTRNPTKRRGQGHLQQRQTGRPGWQMCARSREKDQVTCEQDREPQEASSWRERGPADYLTDPNM